MMKFNFDSQTLAVQIPSGIILGLVTMSISRFIHFPLIPTSISTLVGAILLLDILHLLGKIEIDVSNLCQRRKFARKVDANKVRSIIQTYLEEHAVFLACLFASLFLMRSVLTLLRK